MLAREMCKVCNDCNLIITQILKFWSNLCILVLCFQAICNSQLKSLFDCVSLSLPEFRFQNHFSPLPLAPFISSTSPLPHLPSLWGYWTHRRLWAVWAVTSSASSAPGRQRKGQTWVSLSDRVCCRCHSPQAAHWQSPPRSQGSQMHCPTSRAEMCFHSPCCSGQANRKTHCWGESPEFPQGNGRVCPFRLYPALWGMSHRGSSHLALPSSCSSWQSERRYFAEDTELWREFSGSFFTVNWISLYSWGQHTDLSSTV